MTEGAPLVAGPASAVLIVTTLIYLTIAFSLTPSDPKKAKPKDQAFLLNQLMNGVMLGGSLMIVAAMIVPGIFGAADFTTFLVIGALIAFTLPLHSLAKIRNPD